MRAAPVTKLKVAIVVSGQSQREIAAQAPITENRLSEIVCGWIVPRDDEKAAIARVLKQPINALFEDSTVEAERVWRRQREHDDPNPSAA